ncbi:MAG TPA: glucose-6-phosphate isomerase, partial [Gemmatimonadetes bacterium]|nr:glucose-6-phosphate isomerase [Gemmatimonadota bacterium]
AVSANHAALDSFGVAPERQLSLWDWVGGRYSICSSMGLGLALTIGWEHFEAMLNGAHVMDEHFATAPAEENLPVILALLGVWNRNMLCASGHAILPYDYHLRWLPAYLQQLEMESNGKSVRRNGQPVECKTCPIIWGELGSNAQHSFAQFLNQGTESISADFIMPARSAVNCQDQHDLATLGGLAQAWVPAVGDSGNFDQAAHKKCHGNCPNSLLIFPELDPSTLGKLVSLFEHKVFVQSVIWDINPFDQWGVQLGKRLISDLERSLSGVQAEPVPVAGALNRLRAWKA